MAFKDFGLNFVGEKVLVGFFFLVQLIDAGGKVSLESLALEDLALFDPKACSSPCLLCLSGVSSSYLSSSLLANNL